MLKNLFKRIGGDPNQKIINRYAEIVQQINAREAYFESLSDADLADQTNIFKKQIADGLAQGADLEDLLNEILVDAFAVVRETSKRTIGLRHYDVQLIGGMILHHGQVAEMRTGEGKTLVATLPLYLNALAGKGVHLVTVNDYLVSRDAQWMAPIFHFLGLTVGVLQMGSRTEGGKKAFLVRMTENSEGDPQPELAMVDRQEAYAADITYGTNSEFGFDYLRDNGRMKLSDRVQRGHHYAIIDEVDNVLIDEARTPLIISGPAYDDAATYARMAQVVKKLRPEDYEVNEKDRTITLTEIGETQVERLLGTTLRDPENPEEITSEQARLFGFLEQALRAEHLFKRDKDYIVQSRQVIIIDQGTGRMMPGRRWSDGLHQAVEAKEGVQVQAENITHATITIQNYFRMYTKLAGMTGTAMTEAEEFSKIYNLESIALPSNLEFRSSQDDADIVELNDTDELNYNYTYYARKDDPHKLPYLWKRKDYPDVVYRTEEAKLRAIVREVIQYHCLGRPLLIGTTSVENSDRLSQRLNSANVQKLLKTLLLRYKWLGKNKRAEDGRVVMALSFLNQPLGDLRNAEMKNLAQSLDLTLEFTDENIAYLLSDVLYLEPEHADALKQVIQKGVPHEVLNAREHRKEGALIAKAGNLGAVTIATNMAGRGVDIKLGGELNEATLNYVTRELIKRGVENVYNLSIEEKAAIWEQIPEKEYGTRAYLVKEFLQYAHEMAKVSEIGGLHVIGSERHEARRIDNQLRGRAARQGDPGSSRFYLSMEDDLMRLFGGQQMDVMMQRLGMDEQLPLEVNMVGRIIEGAQTRVEGANFDSRKHVLEYDDVLNTQRQTIYKQRDRIFLKDDLTDDILELLENEINTRIPEEIDDIFIPNLLYWMSAIQPGFPLEKGYYPSLTYKQLLDELQSQELHSQAEIVRALLKLADNAAKAYQERIVADVQTDIERYQNLIDAQFQDRVEGMQTYFEQLYYADEAERPTDQEIISNLKALTRLEIKSDLIRSALIQEEQSPQPPNQEGGSKYNKKKSRKGKSVSLRSSTLIMENLDEAQELFEEELFRAVNQQTVERLIGAVTRRLPEDINLKVEELITLEWGQVEEQIIEEINQIFNKRRARFSADERVGGLVERLENLFRYDLFVETTTRELKSHFSKPVLSGNSSIDEGIWRSITNQINIYIDRRKIAPNPDANLLADYQQLIEDALSELDPSGYNLSSADWAKVISTVKAFLEKFYPQWQVVQLIAALGLMSQERKTVFDKGKKATQTSNWFSYRHYAALALEGKGPGEIKQVVLNHLQGAHQARIGVYGVKVWGKLSPDWAISDLPELVHTYLKAELGQAAYANYQNGLIRDIRQEDVDIFIQQIGRYELSEYYREIFLRVISGLWVEYITEMEALRVKIGLEAYAQRDPLVAYKTQASEMFQGLFSNMQRDVVNRMFKPRPIYKGEKEERLALINAVREARKEVLAEEQVEEQAEESQAAMGA
ncbi:MAG: hypothetical protein JW757_13900 [Anaerolineales bacterium]|nr:hypothetical protein [Anaerolineales bacterium]